VNPVFYLSVPPMSINFLWLTGACLICGLVFLQLGFFIIDLFYARCHALFFAHVCCVNLIKYEYESL